MLAERHLAEDAFALHLLLQYLEGLVDVIDGKKITAAKFSCYRRQPFRRY